MKKITFVALAALALSSCNSGPQFKVNGVVSDANGKMLYLESSALEGIIPLDSVKLKGNGSFSFRQARPESPEFYRLRVDDKVINFSVDSTETIEIKAPYVDFAAAYTVEGSENSQKIKELSLKQARLQNRVNALLAAARSNKLGHDVFEDSLLLAQGAEARRAPFPVLYEDGRILVIDKPSGLLSMASDREKVRTAYRMAGEYVRRTRPGGRVFIVHRLDRDTSGVLLFAKDEETKRAYQEHWDALVRRRGYLAV